MRDTTKAAVDTFWSNLFGLTVDGLHRPGTTTVNHIEPAGSDRVYILVLGPSIVVSSPPSVEADFTRILGPSLHAYLDESPPLPAVGVREVAYGEVELHLREVCGEADWAEAGFAEPAERCFAVEQDGRVVAAANLTPWRGYPGDVGVLVSPEATGRGLGTAVAARAAAVAIELGGIARYRALETNAPSLRIARKLGFTPYGRNLVVKS